MKKKVLWLIIIFCSIVISIKAQYVTIVQTPPIVIQQESNWCWASCIQNVLHSYGVYVSQNNIVKATYGRYVDLPIFNPEQAIANLLASNSLVASQGMVVHPLVRGIAAPNQIIRELVLEQSPMIFFYHSQETPGHVVICYGAKYSGDINSPIIEELWIKDPWDGMEKIWPASQLASLCDYVIALRVAPRPPGTFLFHEKRYYITLTFEMINTSNNIKGRIWFMNQDESWHIINTHGQDCGSIPEN